jgi:KDO2-lipid IV(A) lauroyltransferase
MQNIASSLSYAFIRCIMFPFSFLSFKTIHRCGKLLGSLLFHCIPHYRKIALSNLALAKDLNLSQPQMIQIAKQSFQNLATVCLEYPLLSRREKFPEIICENPEEADRIIAQGKGIVFFCGHLSNWEVLFIEGTFRMKGIAIGKPIHNQRLYRWIVSIREKFGGRIIQQRNAIGEGLRALKKGVFVGIVGDQAMPASGYSAPFLGRSAWSSTAPALLSYKTKCPIMVATTKRIPGGYRIHYSDPIWPDTSQPIEQEAIRLMDLSLTYLQDKIKESPGEWLWQHNRWKQQTPKIILKRFRHDSIYIILPENPQKLEEILSHLPFFRTLYPLETLFIAAPSWLTKPLPIETDETFFYTSLKETLRKDLRYKLIFDFAYVPKIKAHYRKQSVFDIFTLTDLCRLAKVQQGETNLSEILKKALCR